MSKRKWTKEEVEQWREKNRRTLYFNKQDSNVFVPKSYGIGITCNWGNPISWVLIVAIIAIIVLIKVFR